MARLDGKVAFITGAARGQGRSHAVRLAEEGADIIALDIAADIASVPYPLARPEDLEETVRQVEALDRRIVAGIADVRDFDQVSGVLRAGLDAFGHVDVVCANAGILTSGEPSWEIPDQRWRDTIDVNLTGVWTTVKAAVPPMIAAGKGGSIIITSSGAALRPILHGTAYGASKAALILLMQGLAKELGPHHIRVNTIHPCAVDTPMIHNDALYRRFRPDLPDPTMGDVEAVFAGLNALPIPWADPRDISDTVIFLASDAARLITGVALPIDAGASL